MALAIQSGRRRAYIEPGSPWENGYRKSFNARSRDEQLNGEVFHSLRGVQILIEEWRKHYNTKRPHSGLGYRPPAPEAIAPMDQRPVIHQPSKWTTQMGLITNPSPDPVRIHPSMARTYRDRVGALIRGLSDAEGMEEAKEALRALVERIALAPDPTGDRMTIDLHGGLASLLRLATGQPLHRITRHANDRKALGASTEAFDRIGELVLVAATGFALQRTEIAATCRHCSASQLTLFRPH